MASLSASPSGRRLSELLEEKQEPFFLDLHLLEKGCSSRLLDGYDTAAAAAMCWPAAAAAGNDAAATVLRRLTSKKKKDAARGGGKKTKKPAAATGLLRVLLSKILHGKAANNRKPAALQSSESFNFKKVPASAPSPGSTKHHLDAIKTDAVEVSATAAAEEEMEYTDSESDDEKQFSPVSVLEHPFESSPVHKCSPSPAAQGSPKNAMAFVRDLLEAAYSPALLTQLLSKTDDLIKGPDAFDDIDDDCYYHHRTSPKNSTFHENDGGKLAAAYWEAHRAELTRVSALVASEVPNSSRIDAADVRPEREDVGAAVEAAVLEQLLQELAVELAGGC